MNLPGFHFVGPFDESTCNNTYWPLLRATSPAWSVIVGGTQIEQALKFAHGVQNDPVRTNVIFRHWKGVPGSENDNGRLSKVTASQWMTHVGNLYRGTKLTILPDNEGGAATIKNATDLLKIAPKEGLRIAFGAWNTHHPQEQGVPFETVWQQYLPLYEQAYQVAADYGPEYVVAAPHIYYSKAPSVENLDGFLITARFLRYIEQQMTAPLPIPVVITEFGRLRNPDGKALRANDGYKLEGVSGVQYAKETLEYVQMFPDWDWVIFAQGEWGTNGSLGVDAAFTGYYKSVAVGQVAMPTAAPPVVELEPIELPPPPPAPEPEPVVLRADDSRWLSYLAYPSGMNAVFVRHEPRVTETNKIGQLTIGAKEVEHIPHEIMTSREQAYAESSGQRWSVIKLTTGIGWVRSDLVRFDPNPPKPLPPKPIDIDVKYIDNRISHIEQRQHALDQLCQALQVYMMTLAEIDASEIDYLTELKEGTSL